MYDYANVVAERAATDGTPFRVILEPDEYGDLDPRKDYGNAGVMYVIDQPRYDVPQEADDVPGIDAAIIDHDFRVVARWLKIFHGATVVLPLYSSYGHDFNVSAGDLDDHPEAGNYIGVTFDTAESRVEICGDMIDPAREYTTEDLAAMTRALDADVQTYRSWAEGDVWRYVVQTAWVDDGTGEITDWDVADSMDATCGGFIGQQWAEEAATEALDSVVAEHDEKVTARRGQDADDAAEIESLRLSELGLPA